VVQLLCLQLVQQALADERRNFQRKRERYDSAMRRYLAALPIEKLRLQLMEQAGNAEGKIH
jgi:hypothetical protein